MFRRWNALLDEMVLQVLMSAGTTNCLFWNAQGVAADNASMEAALASMAAACGNVATVTPIGHVAVPFNSTILVSGVTAGSKRVYRVSELQSAVVNAVVITLPGENVPTTVNIPAGAAGVWVSH